MSLEVISIGSSSSGNSYIIKAGSANILLDVGLAAKTITGALDECGIELDSIDGVLVTHEHIDHVKSVRAISRKCSNAVFYASRGTVAGCSNFQYVPEDRLEIVRGGDCVAIGDAEVSCFRLSHDANEPLGYSVTADGQKLTVITDTGIVTEEIFNEMLDADILVFEANHEVNLLMMGPYPYSVKQRIKGDLGHLSNVTSAEVLNAVLKRKNAADPDAMPSIMLAHLSDKNNSPYQAKLTIVGMLQEKGWLRDEHYKLTVAAREGLTYID